MGFLDILGLGEDRNPADKAMPFLNKIAPMEKEYYNPYIARGNQAGDVNAPQYNRMSSDPVAFLESLLKGYEPSRSYGLKRDEMLRSAGNTAAAGICPRRRERRT